MRTPRLARPLVLASLLFLLAPAALPTAALAAWSHDPLAYTPIAPSSGDQVMAQMLPDGAGGAFALFTDKRSGNEDIYLQRTNSAGQTASGWPSTGFQVCSVVSRKLEPQMVSDNSGGVIVVWADYRPGNGDIYAQRVLGNGTLAGGSWPSGGLQLSIITQTERRPTICADGAGGALVAWESSYSSTDTDVYGAHVTSGGSISFDEVLDFSLQDARQVSVATDNVGGYFVVYQDSSSLYQAHVKVFGLHANGSGTILAGPTKIVLSPDIYTDENPRIVPDGSGGFYGVWMENDSHSSFDLNVERFAANLSVAPGYPNSPGANLTLYGLDTPDFNVIADGAGGFIFSWQERSGHAMVGRGAPTGYEVPGWPVELANTGLAIVAAPLASDGSAGVIGCYFKGDIGSGSVIAQRVAANGGSVAHWGTGAVVRSPTVLFGFVNVYAATDGAHGAIVGWTEASSGLQKQVYAERVDRFGALGSPEPAITSIADVVGDQGGHVRLGWNSSYLDADPYYAISSYYVWRQTPTASAYAAMKLGAKWADDASAAGAPVGAAAQAASAAAIPGRLFRHSSAPGYAWEFIASQPTNGSSQYTYTAATTRDSTGTANPRTAFMVEARWTGGTAFWDSAPDSGYSVDNRAPSAPAAFTGQYLSGTSRLHWLRNTEVDLAGYRLYRGTSQNFTPGPTNLAAAPPDTGYVDAAGAAYYYKLSAVDIHGNESVFATLLPTGVAGVPVGTPAPKVALAVLSENPTSNGAMLRFDLTRNGPARLAVYNAAGQQVRVIAGGDFPAGEWFRRWDGLEAGGAIAPSGLYFVRLEAEGKTLTRKLTLER